MGGGSGTFSGMVSGRFSGRTTTASRPLHRFIIKGLRDLVLDKLSKIIPY